MPHLLHHHPPPPPIPFFESTPPIPPRTRSRPSSRQQLQPSLPPSQPILLTPNHQLNNSHSFFRLDDLPSPDREWQLLENIGDGTYGEVFRAKNIRNTDFNAAVKIMHPTNEVLEEIEQEYRVLLELSNHENLCRFYGAYLKHAPPPPPPPPRNPITSPPVPIDKAGPLSIETNSISSLVSPSTASVPAPLDQLWLVMELCTSGSVTDLAKATLKANQRLDESIIAYIIRETLKALYHLHSNNVIHRDVKGHNILITGDGHIKLIDFGVSAYLNPNNGRRNTSVGTPFFMAPEVIACERQMDYDYDTRADVWSTGITAIEIAEGEPPLADMHPMRALVSIPRNPPPCLRRSQEWSNEFHDFIRQCLIKDFEARPTVAHMLNHPFISQIPSDGLDARRRIIQIVHRYKRCYDLCGKKSRETCGVKNGHIRGKSETCSSPITDITRAGISSYSPTIESIIPPPPPPPKRIIQILGKPYNPPHQFIENHKRLAPPPPPPPFVIENGYCYNDSNIRMQSQQNQIYYKTKRKSQSRRQQKQIQMNHQNGSGSPQMSKQITPSMNNNNNSPIHHPSISKKSNNINFYNSTYDSTYPINSPNQTHDTPLSHHQINSFSTDDLAQLETFDEQSIITHMYNRFLANQVYTYIGDILVAVNPFRSLPIYGKDAMIRYRSSVKSEQPPHIYALADFTYQAMLHDLENQYIVISGESGSGKTQSANFLVKQLTYLGNAPNKSLQEKILQINPLIEGFGNARTIINDNSSRFGKYLEMLFTKQGQVTGARLSEYLLEKTRVVNQGHAERNFHIFYYLFHGLASSVPNDEKSFYLSTNQTYRYLKTDLEETEICKEKFSTIEKCFEIIGFQQDEVKSIYRILAGLLHLGNINFHQSEGHFIDGKTCLTDRKLLEIVCELFGIDIAEFDLALTTCNIVTRGETIQRSTTLQESQSTRDAMAKALYNRLFSWIVNRISALLAPTKESLNSIIDEQNYNANNNNNNDIDEEPNPSNPTILSSHPPQTVMYAMKRTFDYLEIESSSSSFVLQLQQLDDDDDDDDLLNKNNNNNNTTNTSSPPHHPVNNHQPTNLINDLNNNKTNSLGNEKPIKNLIENWSKAVAASSSNWVQVIESKSNKILPNSYSRFNFPNRAISETNLALRKKTVENNVKKHYQSSNNLCINSKQPSSPLLLPILPSIKQEKLLTNHSNININSSMRLLNSNSIEQNDHDALKIAILDIFGFENFSTNTFEQLCINIANEQIQYYFNQHVFSCERQEYINENLIIQPLPANMDFTFYDNRPLLDMFLNKPVGILALIDEESRFPKATDYTLVDKLNANFSSSPLYIRSKSSFSSSSQHSISSSSSSTLQSIPLFSIIHFAGQVQYDARGFLEKNRDYLAPEIIQILRSSRVQLVSSLFQLPLTKTGTLQDNIDSNSLDTNNNNNNNTLMPLNASHNRVQATVSTSFRYSLTDLFSKMVHGSPKFVRCFKPNNDRVPGCFDIQTVLEQLKYSGILAAAKIRRYGFSHRISFTNFIQRYSILVYPVTTDLPFTRETCENILHKLKMQNWTTGKSKVFLKYYHAEQLTRLCSNMMRAIITIQSYIRMRLARLRLKQRQYKHSNDMIIQELHRHPKFSRPIADNEQIEKERAIIIIQSCIRGYLQRCYLKELNKKICQPTYTYETAALIIQKCYRGFLVRKVFNHFRQRLNSQILCFLQQIELISNDFFTKIVKTNYSVSINNSQQNKYAQKFSQFLFPSPPPLPLPRSSSFSISSPPLPPPPNAPISIKPTVITTSMALPPPPPALFLPSRASPQSRHQVIVTNRSPSPSTSSISKFAQVRDIFARAEAAASSSSNSHHHYHPPPPLHHQQIPIKNSTQNSHQVPPIERARSPKSGTVLDIVQEYQRQYINNHQPAYKRFAHLGGGNPNRPLSFNGNSHIKPRGIGSFITNNINNKSLLQNKQPPTVPSNFITSSSKQPAKPITRESSMSTQPKYVFHVLLRKTGQDLTAGQTFSKRRVTNETKQIDFRSVLKSRSTLNTGNEHEFSNGSNSAFQQINDNRIRMNDL